MWSHMRRKLEEDCLCPALRGRVRYFAAAYRKSHDREGRAAILLDGEEILSSGYYNYAPFLWRRQCELRREGAEWKASCCQAEQEAADFGLFDQRGLYRAFQAFDRQSVEESLTDRNPLVRILALLDRRLGKRRLLRLEPQMAEELDFVRQFYWIRREAEGLPPEREPGDGAAE